LAEWSTERLTVDCGKTKEACDVLAKADPLLKMVNDSEVKQTASELKKILECK